MADETKKWASERYAHIHLDYWIHRMAHAKLIEDRVEAALILHSWCPPVCLAYACELNGFGHVVYDQPADADPAPKPLLRKVLAKILSESTSESAARIAPQHVYAACQRLVEEGRLAIDEHGLLYVQMHPKSEPTPSRRAKVLARKFRLPVAYVMRLEAAQPTEWERSLLEMKVTRTEFLKLLSEARAREQAGLRQVETQVGGGNAPAQSLVLSENEPPRVADSRVLADGKGTL